VRVTGAQLKVPVSQEISFIGVSTDTRSVVPGNLFVALKGERFDAHDFVLDAAKRGATGLIVERDISLPVEFQNVIQFRVTDSLKALGQLAQFHRNRFKIPIGAVTGSNGKTTTKELIACILETRGAALKTFGNLNNEIGVPLTLFGLNETHQTAIVEMGMNHFGEIDRLAHMAIPDAGLITIVQPAHLEGVGSLDGVAIAKTELFRALRPDSTAVINLDDERIVERSQNLKCKQLTFGRSKAADVRLISTEFKGVQGQHIILSYAGSQYSYSLCLLGAHNAMNSVAAFSLCLALGFTPVECVKGLESARAHARRLELKKARNGATVIDDCYNANPESMLAAIATLKELSQNKRAILVLGDMRELGAAQSQGHETVMQAAQVIDVIFVVGSVMQVAAKPYAKVRHFDDVDSLNKALHQELKTNDIVLVKASRGMRLERVVSALTGEEEGSH
jgi:UDP-N-acetylmuramoyl-tripeptide--D-alanyl-D-alanine ligase